MALKIAASGGNGSALSNFIPLLSNCAEPLPPWIFALTPQSRSDLPPPHLTQPQPPISRGSTSRSSPLPPASLPQLPARSTPPPLPLRGASALPFARLARGMRRLSGVAPARWKWLPR